MKNDKNQDTPNPSQPGTAKGCPGQKKSSTGSDAAANAGAKPQEQAQSPPGLDAAKHRQAQEAAAQAEAIKEVAFPAYMATALGLDGQFGPAGYRLYLAQLVEAAGNPTDPIERMMIEQLALMHHRIGALHSDAGGAKSAIAAKIYNAATARLLGEFRRTALAIREYRSPRKQERKLRLAGVG